MNKRIFIILFIATVITMLGLGSVDPILPLYAKSMNANGIELGIIFAGFALSSSIFAPIVGRFSDQHGRKNLMVAGLFLFAIVSALYVIAVNPLELTCIRILQGFSAVLVSPIAQAYIGDLTPPGQEGKYMNLFFISFFGGMALGPLLGGYLTDRFNMNTPFYAMGVLSLLVMLFTLLLVPESRAIKRHGSQKGKYFKSLMPVFKDKPMIGIMSYMFTRGFYRWGFNTFFPLLAVGTDHMSLASIGLILSLYMLFGSLIQYPFGLLVDRFPTQKVNFIFLGGVLSALSMCAITFSHTFVMFSILTVCMGSFSSIARASAIAIRTERGRVFGMGAVNGAFTTSLSAGQVLGPLAFGVIADVSNIPTAFLIGGLFGLAGTIASVMFFRSETSL